MEEGRRITTRDIEAELAQLRQQFDLYKAFADLRHDVTLQLNYFKLVGASGVILVAVLSFFGFKEWKDVRESAEAKIVEVSKQSYDLARGFSLSDNGREAEAIEPLERAYERNHFDGPVVRTLLADLEHLGDSKRSLQIVKDLRSDNHRFDNFSDPVVYFFAAHALFQSEVRKRFIDDQSGFNRHSDKILSDESRDLFELELKRLPPDADEDRSTL
jgi:hypothetical protein